MIKKKKLKDALHVEVVLITFQVVNGLFVFNTYIHTYIHTHAKLSVEVEVNIIINTFTHMHYTCIYIQCS